jgi:hypothetical protein
MVLNGFQSDILQVLKIRLTLIQVNMPEILKNNAELVTFEKFKNWRRCSKIFKQDEIPNETVTKTMQSL